MLWTTGAAARAGHRPRRAARRGGLFRRAGGVAGAAALENALDARRTARPAARTCASPACCVGPGGSGGVGLHDELHGTEHARAARRRQYGRPVGRPRAPLGDPALPRRLGGTTAATSSLPVWDGAPREALYVAARSDRRPFGSALAPLDPGRHHRRALRGGPRRVPSTEGGRLPDGGDQRRVPRRPPEARPGPVHHRRARPLLREDRDRRPTPATTPSPRRRRGPAGPAVGVGGKVTTYRRLAEETVDRVAAVDRPRRAACATPRPHACPARPTPAATPSCGASARSSSSRPAGTSRATRRSTSSTPTARAPRPCWRARRRSPSWPRR